MYSDGPVLDPRERLLGGWRDLKEDVARLQRLVAGAGRGVCACQKAAPRRVPCPCGDAIERDHAAFCDSCAQELLAVSLGLGRVEEDALRSLPGVVECLADDPESQRIARLVEARLTDLFARFRRVRAAQADRLRGCRMAQLADVKAAAQDVFESLESCEAALKAAR